MNMTPFFSMRFFVRSGAVALVLCLAGCGVLPKKENIQVFAPPHVKVAADAGWPTVNWQLQVTRPTANKMLDSSHIVVSPTPDTLQVYYAASWPDTVPDMLQTVIAEAFEDSGKITAVARQATAVRADYMLLMDIRHFEAVYANAQSPPNALIEIGAKLIDNNGHVVAARTFRQSTPASDTAVTAVSAAFESGLNGFTHELIGWTLNAGQQAHNAKATTH